MGHPASSRKRTTPAEGVRGGGGLVGDDGLLASVQRLTGLGVWAYDSGKRESWWSDQAKEIHRIEIDNPTVEDVFSRYSEADCKALEDLFERAVGSRESFTRDAVLVGEGTTERAIRIRCEPRVSDGHAVRLHGTVRDITDTKRREQRIEVLRRTSQRLKQVHSSDAVAEVLADASKNILGLVNTTIRLVDDRRTNLRTIVATEECVERAGERPDYPVAGDSPAARVFRSGDPEWYADVTTNEDSWDRGELVSGIYVPIGDHGVLSAGDVVPGAFDDRDLEVAALLGQVGAEALTRIDWARRSRAV